jgi:hypothetical protein
MPVNRLQSAFEAFADAARLVIPNWFSSADMLHSFAEKLRGQFKVNTFVIEVRLDREGVWPAC